MIFDLLKSMRMKQWLKNGFVFAALVFTKNVFVPPMVLKVSLTFFLFCMVSGAVYIINDILDRNRDQLHPIKKQRPIASGRLDVRIALVFGILLAIVSVSSGFVLYRSVGYLLLLYFFLNLAYSLKLKEIVLLDVFSIATGFVIRVVAGSLIIPITPTPWIIICTLLLALFLAFSKRRHEIIILEEHAVAHRKILLEYSTDYLDQMISVVTASTVISYSLYTLSEDTVTKFQTEKLIYTVPFVLYGIFRYLYLVHQKEGGGNPTEHLFSDFPLIVNIILWVITAMLIIYYP
jgi:4-hydroxybenzoate polyprenyltransferase